MYEFLLKLKTQWEEIEKKTAVLEIEIQELEKVAANDRPENCEGMLGYGTIIREIFQASSDLKNL
jgi:hypothetical protein